MKKTTIILILLFSKVCFSQNQDSLLTVFKNTSLPDTIRLKALHDIANSYSFSNPDSAIFYATQEQAYAEKINNLPYQAEAYQIIGTANYIRQKLETCIYYYKKSLAIHKKRNNEPGMAALYNNMGIMYEIKADYLTAIKYYLDGLAIREKTNNISGASKLNMNIANVYFQLNDHVKARKHYQKAFESFVELKDSVGIAQAYMGIGLNFESTGPTDSAFFYFEKSKKIHERLGNEEGYNQCLINLGVVYMKTKQYDEAQKAFSTAKIYYDQHENTINNATIYENLGTLSIDQKKYKDGVNYCLSSLKISLDYELKELEKNACLCLYTGYTGLHNDKKALEYYKQYVEVKDSLRNEDITKEVARKEIQHEYDKKILADSLANAEKERINELNHEREVEKQKTYTYSGIIGFVLMLAILVVMYRGYSQKKKSHALLEQKNALITSQKEEVEIQKHLVEEKSKEITDSIEYARNIQQAILPPMSLFKQYLRDGFVLFKPKDVVSGDFYWLEHVSDTTYFAVADCTGHGVPGAMVSVVCHNALNRAVKEFNITDTGKILDKVRNLIIETFEKSDRDVKDGMDVALCSLSENGGKWKLSYAGAQNPLWLLRGGSSEMEEIKGDKQPVGLHIDSKPFTTHNLEVSEGDSIYLFTDGFPDQFGGNRGKKLKYKPFKDMLIAHSSKDPNTQRNEMDKEFVNWKGSNEQIDDVCILCVKV